MIDGIGQAARVRAWISERAEEMAALLVRLVASETENPPGRNLAECAEILGGEMDRLSLGPEMHSADRAGADRSPHGDLTEAAVADGAYMPMVTSGAGSGIGLQAYAVGLTLLGVIVVRWPMRLGPVFDTAGFRDVRIHADQLGLHFSSPANGGNGRGRMASARF